MKRALACAALLAGFTAAAQAADLSLDSVKNGASGAVSAIPEVGPVTWGGVTFYGTVDVGYAYVDNGAEPNRSGQWGASYSVFGSPYNRGDVSTINNNARQLSNFGLKFDYGLGYDFHAIGRLESAFNPLYGEIADNCASLVQNAGRFLWEQNKNGDGTRCGQAFNSAAWGGVSHPLYGTLTVGRQGNLVNDGMGTYDVIAGSPAFSLLGYSSTAGSGYGSTETSAWDQSVKYLLTYGPVHAAGMYTNGGDGTAIVDDAYGANLGFSYKGFSVDGYYQQANGAVSVGRIPLALSATGGLIASTTFAGTGTINACNAAFGTCPDYLLGTVRNYEGWDIMAKYVFEVPGFFGAPAVSTKDAPCGGLKDGPCPVSLAKVTISGGFQSVEQSNPDHFQNFYSGNTTVGGYRYIINPNASWDLYGTNREQQTAWAGINYKDGPWSLSAAWYYTDQNTFIAISQTSGARLTCVAATAANVTAKAAGRFFGNTIGNNCSGDLNQGSFVVDYTVTRNLDLYGGISFVEQTGGLNSASLSDNSFAFASGVRLRW